MKSAACDQCGVTFIPHRPPAADGEDNGRCVVCDCDGGPVWFEARTHWHVWLYAMLESGKMACTVVLTGGTHITGDLELAQYGLRMVSPDHAPGYLPENAPPPTCERFFDYKDVVMVTRRLT